MALSMHQQQPECFYILCGNINLTICKTFAPRKKHTVSYDINFYCPKSVSIHYTLAKKIHTHCFFHRNIYFAEKKLMEVICLQDEAFYNLIEQVVVRLKEKNGQKQDKWISDEEAMQFLNIKSKTTLQKLRDEGKIRFTQPQKKIILYDRNSIKAYLEQSAKNTF